MVQKLLMRRCIFSFRVLIILEQICSSGRENHGTIVLEDQTQYHIFGLVYFIVRNLRNYITFLPFSWQ